MPPKRKATVVRWLVQSKFTGHVRWHDEPPTPFMVQNGLHVVAYGLDDGTVTWEV